MAALINARSILQVVASSQSFREEREILQQQQTQQQRVGEQQGPRQDSQGDSDLGERLE